jgi:hypothetical protein
LKSTINNRLKKLENCLKSSPHYRSAIVIYDPKIVDSLDDVQVDADVVLMLPDNGRRNRGKAAPQSSYVVYYPT